MLQARAHRAGAKVASEVADQTNTAGVVPSALILRSNIAEPRNDIVEKRLESAPIGAVLSSVSGRQGRSEILPRRLDRRSGPRWAAAPANRTASQLPRGDMVAI